MKNDRGKMRNGKWLVESVEWFPVRRSSHEDKIRRMNRAAAGLRDKDLKSIIGTQRAYNGLVFLPINPVSI